MKMNKVLFIGILLVFLLFISCSKDDDSEIDYSNSIKIGVILPFSGESAAYGSHEMQAINLAVKEINDAGGVLGKDIALIVKNSSSDPVYGPIAALELVEDEEVLAILGADRSDVSFSILNMIEEYNFPIISGSAVSNYLTGMYPHGVFFRTVSDDVAIAEKIALRMLTLGDTTHVRIIYVDDIYGSTQANIVEYYFEYLGGDVEIERILPFESGKFSYYEEIESLFIEVDTLSEAIPNIVLIAYPKCGAQIIRDWKVSGYEANWILSDCLKTEAFIQYAGSQNVEGLIGISSYAGENNYVQYNKFKEAYEEFTGEDPTQHRCLENWYDAMILLAYAIIKADTLDPETIRNSLVTISAPPGSTVTVGEFRIGKDILNTEVLEDTVVVRLNINYEGASGNVNFNVDGDVVGHCEFWEIENGKFVTIP